MHQQLTPQDIERKKKEFKELEERRKARDLSDMKKVLNLPEGRRLLWSLLEDARVFHQTFTGNGSETFFNEGKRYIGLGLLKSITEAKPEAFFQMQKEAASDPLKVLDQKGNS